MFVDSTTPPIPPEFDHLKKKGGRRVDGKTNKRHTSKPLVSVITVVLNGEKTLNNTIESVLNQDYGSLEFIVIDGGSTDKTLETLQKHGNDIDYWISEPDTGIYNAMNKGVAVATGDWVIFLGADDRFIHNRAVSNFESFFDSKYSVVFGNVRYESRHFKSFLSMETLRHNTLHHQSAFYNRDNFKGWKYDENLQLISDYELNLKIFRNKLDYFYHDEDVSFCGDFGACVRGYSRSLMETNKIRSKYVHPIFMPLLYFVLMLEFPKFIIKSYIYSIKRFMVKQT